MSSPKQIALGSSIIIVLLLSWAIYGLYFRFYERTTDAYVTGNMIPLNSQIAGNVQSIFVDETQKVTQGQLLVQLDSSDARLALESAKAQLADQVRYVRSLIAEIKQSEALLQAKGALLKKAKYDLGNRQAVVDEGSIPKEEFEHAQIALSYSHAELIAEQFHLLKLKVQLLNSTPENHPRVELAKTRLKEAFLQLKRCSIYAPTDGIVTQRTVQISQAIKPEDKLLAIIPLDQIWIEANFKETQLKNIRIGQHVEFTVDMWGHDTPFHGHVIGQNPGTGAVFSILPPQNATGNWIKIVQRVPVRIGFDIEQLTHHPLWLGLSAKVKVNTQASKLPLISSLSHLEKPYTTSIYEQELNGVQECIHQIIKANLE